MFDAGYDVPRLAFLLAEEPVELLVRVRSDRVFYPPPPPRQHGTIGHPSKHGREFKLADPATQPEPDAVTVIDTSRYGTVQARAWPRLYPRLTHRGAWTDNDGPLPIIEGSIIRLTVQRLPGDRNPKPLWLWPPDPTSRSPMWTAPPRTSSAPADTTSARTPPARPTRPRRAKDQA